MIGNFVNLLEAADIPKERRKQRSRAAEADAKIMNETLVSMTAKLIPLNKLAGSCNKFNLLSFYMHMK